VYRSAMARVQLESIHKVYPNGYRALSGFDLALEDGELMVLVGPSGSGKSTALRIVAGLESPSSGRVLIGERDITAVAPGERDVAMVFQSYALYPHKSVRDNLGFGLRMRSVSKAEIARRTEEIAARLSLTELLDRKPAQLSGGQRQRVALGRALVRKPQVFLLDEPLSNLDAKLRAEMRAEIGRLHAAVAATMIYVTHDQEEAMTLGDRIAVLGKGGRIEQLGPPLALYDRPDNAFVADFIGVPRINWFEGQLEGADFVCSDFRLEMASGARAGGPVRLGVRPHDLALAEDGAGGLRGQVELVETLGPHLLVHAKSVAGVSFRLLAPAGAAVRRGDLMSARVNAERAHVFHADTGARAS
jgi:multiple sugar transport system ATP-binding protein